MDPSLFARHTAKLGTETISFILYNHQAGGGNVTTHGASEISKT